MELIGKELDFDTIVKLVKEELERANEKFPMFYSKHHGYAVILEELEEMWDEIKMRKPNPCFVQRECIQMTTMCFKFLMSKIYEMDD